MKTTLNVCVALTALALVAAQSTAAVMLIDGGIADGNGDFNYEGGGATIPGTLTPNENIPRDRFLVSSGTTGQGLDIDGWTLTRVAYSGGNAAFGLDGNFGFDAASFEPANTGSGQAFTNGNDNTVVDLIADQISYSGNAGDVINLNYLLGSDSGSANATVTLTLDAGLGSEQVASFPLVTRTGTARDGSNAVAEQYIATAAFSTVDLTFQMNPNGSTRSLIDDVRLSLVPEPTTSALAWMCLLAVTNAIGRVRRIG